MANDITTLQLDEVNLLGNIFLDTNGEALLNASQHLQPDDFSDIRNKEIYHACLEVQKKGIIVDPSSVIQELKNLKLLDSVGGEEYLQLIIDKTMKVAPIGSYITSISEKSILNKFLNKINSIAYDAKNKPITNVSEFIGKSADAILEISQQRNVSEAKTLLQVSDNLIERLVKQTKEFKELGIDPKGITGINTGYEALDKLTKGWHKEDMIVIAARPSVGKTAFALNLLYNVAKQKKPVVFFSLEMSAESILMRLLSLSTKLTSDQINNMKFLPGSTKSKLILDTGGDRDIIAQAEKLQKGFIELGNLPFYIDDSSGSTMMDISTKLKKLQNQIREIKKMDIGLVVIDYLGLIQGTGQGTDRQQEVLKISQQIKQTARQLHVPMIALSQLSRDTEKRKEHEPQLSDIRDSGAIEQDADMIMLLYRPDYYTQQQRMGSNQDKGDNDNVVSQNSSYVQNDALSPVQINLAKNRNGATGIVNFIFDKEHCQFSVSDATHEE